MLELAGEIADGVVLWVDRAGPTSERVAVPAIRRGRERAGREARRLFDFVAAVPAAHTVDGAAGRSCCGSTSSRATSRCHSIAPCLVQSSFADELGAYDRAPSAAAVPDRLAAALGAVGDFRRVASFIAAHRDAGVTLPAVRPVAFPHSPHYLPTIEAASAC